MIRPFKGVCRVWFGRFGGLGVSGCRFRILGQLRSLRSVNIGAYIVTNTILGVAYYSYSRRSPETLF